MRLILIFGGLHLCVMALGAVMLLLFLREDRRWSSEEDDEGPPGGGPPPKDPPRPPGPGLGGPGLPLPHMDAAQVRRRGPVPPGERWPRAPRRDHPGPARRPAPTRTRVRS